MPKLKLAVSTDEFFEAHGGPAIVGPEKTLTGQAWVLYLPGALPCICDCFEDAADAMRRWLAPRVRKRRCAACNGTGGSGRVYPSAQAATNVCAICGGTGEAT